MANSILEKARRLESAIARRLDGAAKEFAASGASEPLEVLHAVVDTVAHQVQPGGRGTRVFPFNRVTVTVVSSTPAARAHLEALFEGDPPLRERLVERLRSRGCELADLTVDVRYAARPQKGWMSPDFHVGFARAGAAVTAATDSPRKPLRLEVTVATGVANCAQKTFAADRIDLGRGTEVRDSRHRLIRRNDVAFTEGSGEVNDTVSRQHAHISYVRATGEYRVHDDGSAHGTSVLRSGRTVPVPTGSRGVRLQPEDEILLGEARLRVRLDNGEG